MEGAQPPPRKLAPLAAPPPSAQPPGALEPSPAPLAGVGLGSAGGGGAPPPPRPKVQPTALRQRPSTMALPQARPSKGKAIDWNESDR